MEKLENNKLSKLQNKTYIVKCWSENFMTDGYTVTVYDIELAEYKDIEISTADLLEWERCNR